MGINVTRQELPQQVLSFLPLCLFVPIGMTYVGIVLFILTWLLSGNFKSKWDNVQQ